MTEYEARNAKRWQNNARQHALCARDDARHVIDGDMVYLSWAIHNQTRAAHFAKMAREAMGLEV